MVVLISGTGAIAPERSKSTAKATTMKLRIRCLETKETLKIDIPSSSCTVHELKQRISQTIPSSSSSNSIHLSLNGKDDLSPSEETLQSFGITSGDLIFFTFKPNGFPISTETHIPKSQPIKLDTQIIQKLETVKKLDTQIIQEPETVNSILEGEEAEAEAEEFMEVDYSDMTVDVNLTKSFSVPGFLRKVFTEELSDDGGRDHKLLVVALHAVFLESGFVLLDPVSFTQLSGSQFWKCYWPWGASPSRMTLFYTLPEASIHHTVELKFHCLGKFFIAHGSLSGGVFTRRVTLNEDQLVPFLNVVWANCGLHEEVNNGAFPEREVFQFWRNVKDGLVLPLLIDLCDKSGLELPPCFMRLPTDLKLKILELLPGVEIAKVSCLSSELRYLASSDDLWKKKYVEQFGDANTPGGGEGGHWKDKFVKSWESRKRRKMISRRRVVDPLRFLGGPNPFPGPWRPHIIGGDYDLLPPQFDNTPPSRLLCPLRNHVPRCHLGGHRSNFT
ncbi:F-box protein SKIP22-like [Nicotiana tabacum]|uniref:F-box protein SKIP22-like n=1 Tax=Nicotiana tabacum TaxID=4097 RepID=A0A1S4D9V2_TOBAC|nr:PREDICTED: F-box protein SKIP22-like [Nicotiana tabacum]